MKKEKIALPSFIIKDIEGNKTSIMKEPSICPDICIEKLLEKRFSKICDNFNDDITSYSNTEIFNKLNKLIQICQAKERSIRPQLEKICYNALVDLFNLPKDTFILEFHLDEDISKNKNFNITPQSGEGVVYKDYSELENLLNEVQKRRVLNIIITGFAINLVNDGIKKSLSDIFSLDEELPHLYSKILKINEYLNFVSNNKLTDKNPQQAGYSKLILRGETQLPILESHGIIFPILLQESIRCFLEYSISNGLPQDKGLADKVIDKCDALMFSIWDERIGPEICKRIDRKIGTKMIPLMVKNISSLPANDFIEYARETFCDTERGHHMNDILYDETLYEYQYSDFEERLLQKQNDADVINDEYFDENELSY